MSRTPGIIQNTSLPSTSSNLKSDPHAINTFPAILEPLKVFNSVADEIADVQLSMFTLYVTDLHA
jgi:hypothetical protein